MDAPRRVDNSSSTDRRTTSRRAALPFTAAPQCASHWSVHVRTCSSLAWDHARPRCDKRPITRSPADFLGRSVPSARSTWWGHTWWNSHMVRMPASSAMAASGNLS
eukprot:4186108-Pyramimonas_sp.AAC.1